MNQERNIFTENCENGSSAKYEVMLADVGFGCCFMPKHSDAILLRIGLNEAINPITNAIEKVNPMHLVAALPALMLHKDKLLEMWRLLDAIGQTTCISEPFVLHEAGTPTAIVYEWMTGVFGARPTLNQRG